MAAMLRERIIAGTLKPGERLPPASDLQVEFTTTKATALRAIGTLADHGYLRTEERSGVFVVDHPPHVSQFAIAFPWNLKHAPSQFYRAIEIEAAKLQAPRRHMSMYHGIVSERDGAESCRLRDLVEHHRLAGLIFANNPYMLDGSPIVRESGIPRVAIANGGAGAGLPTVYPDLEGFWDRALERLAAKGRRHVAVLMLAMPGSPESHLAALRQRCARHGLSTRAEWVHAFSLDNAAWAQTVAQLLFQAGGSEHPDALLIADDNFVTPATAGVAAAGVNVPRDLDIVAMANFPHPTPSAVPVERLGFDISRLVAVCMELIAQERQGRTPPAHTAIPALFEEELSR
jgi:DNA-binding LacI/PurR family transcriptional regulator